MNGSTVQELRLGDISPARLCCQFKDPSLSDAPDEAQVTNLSSVIKRTRIRFPPESRNRARGPDADRSSQPRRYYGREAAVPGSDLNQPPPENASGWKPSVEDDKHPEDQQANAHHRHNLHGERSCGGRMCAPRSGGIRRESHGRVDGLFACNRFSREQPPADEWRKRQQVRCPLRCGKPGQYPSQSEPSHVSRNQGRDHPDE